LIFPKVDIPAIILIYFGRRAKGDYQGAPIMKHDSGKTIVCVVGLGYVGLSLAKAFSKSQKVIGFDIDSEIVSRLSRDNKDKSLLLTDNPREIRKADFIIIAVPTPVTKSKEPDLSHVTSASRIVSQNMKKGSTVIVESTVYPGVTEEVVKPVLEKSGLSCGTDFNLGYSPERINPGDKEHTIDKVTKVVAGMDGETTELIAELYRRVTPHIFKAKDIKTAEAAKIIENVQRDLNIALVNELSVIFAKMGLSTKDILEAAATKWNFHRYSPGLVGGYCIPVDPYYLVYKAKELGYHPVVILAGRSVNDHMSKHVTEIAVRALNDVGKVIKGSKILIIGLTYKENVADARQTPVKEVIRELKEYGAEIWGYDPLLNNIDQEFGIKGIRNIEQAKKGVDCIILTVAHDAFKQLTLYQLKRITNNNPILIDVRGFFNQEQATGHGFHYRCL